MLGQRPPYIPKKLRFTKTEKRLILDWQQWSQEANQVGWVEPTYDVIEKFRTFLGERHASDAWPLYIFDDPHDLEDFEEFYVEELPKLKQLLVVN